MGLITIKKKQKKNSVWVVVKLWKIPIFFFTAGAWKKKKKWKK